jgi:PadR family transcriptional regulator AphA
MEYVILGLLILQPMTLYNINKSFEKGISLFYSASLGSIQTTLQNLLKKKIIYFEAQVDNGRNKKVYHITPEGHQVFMNWMIEPIPLNKLEVTLLSKIYFLGLIESKETRRFIVSHMINRAQQMERQLSSAEADLESVTVPDSYKDIFCYQVKTLDYGIKAHGFAIGWLKEMLENIK